MRKIRKLSLFVILGVVICALIFIGISSLDANSIGEKPDKPPGKPDKPEKPGEPEATWAVRIPTADPDSMFYGRGDGYYENNDPNIRVSVKKNTMAGPWRKYFNFGYAFDFTLTNENVGTDDQPANQVGFQFVGDLYDVEYPDTDKPCCKFPGDFCAEEDCYGYPPNCMADFLNNEHPYSSGTGEEDYQYFWFRVNIFDQDIESMQVGLAYSYLFGDGPDPGEPGDYLSIVARYRQDCYPEPAYHDVELYRNINWFRAQNADPPNPQNIEIERLDAAAYKTYFGIECEAVWRIWVLPVDYNNIAGFLKVKERYCTREKNKTKWYYPLEATGKFSFYIDFIKITATDGTQ
jgi:hypothetical protein